MKQPRDAAALAASLTNAANAPLPLPERATASVISMPQRTETPPQTEALPPKKAAKIKIMSDTVGMTLRPSREAFERLHGRRGRAHQSKGQSGFCAGNDARSVGTWPPEGAK